MRNRPPNVRILTIRQQKVVLDSDLAAVYGVPTRRLNEQFRRNRKRFPEDFAFQLTAEEFAALTSQIATLDEGRSSKEPIRSQSATGSSHSRSMRSQIATASRRNIRYRPWVFTEHGAIMAAERLHFAGSFGFPDEQAAAAIGGGQQLAVGAKFSRIDPVGVLANLVH